ncbi:MAG: glycosyltransferase family 2 protein [Acidobacteriota bacterium]|nr:glycosyltransferase family 2 protein [Acidobacteriota bacterium]MDH3785449.1 glycosyltransferase family 2 protein [Acidobacteriota bacterium]
MTKQSSSRQGALFADPQPIRVDVVIPAFNEEQAIGRVLVDLPNHTLRQRIVVDNGSTDRTANVAREHGGAVIHEEQRGYGSACLAGLAYIRDRPPHPDIVVFIDGDHSDHPQQLESLLKPILDDEADLVIGSRTLGEAEPGALLPQARFGNWLATFLIRHLYGVSMTDLGPFRAIRWKALEALEMRDRDFGWTVEMQVKAARRGLGYAEVPVSYRRRVGQSKITGTLSGTVRAGIKILYTIFRQRV